MFLRNDIGIVVRQNGACFSKFASAKLQRGEEFAKFCANLWRFEMLKSPHFPSVFWGKIIFFVSQKYTDFKVSLLAKVTPLAK